MWGKYISFIHLRLTHLFSEKALRGFLLYLHLILICVKCTIFLLENPFCTTSRSILLTHKILIFSLLLRSDVKAFCKLHISNQKQFLYGRQRNEESSFNFTSNSVHEEEKHEKRHRYFTICWCTSKSSPCFSKAIFYTKSNRIRDKVDSVDTSYKIQCLQHRYQICGKCL